MKAGMENTHGDVSAPSLESLLLDDAQDFSGFGYFVWDMVSNDLDWSDGLYKIFGVEKGKFVPSHQAFFDAVHVDDRPIVQQAIESAIEQDGSFMCEERIYRPSGELRFLESRGRIVADASGKPLRLVGLCHDVTDSKTQFDSLRNQINGLELLAEFSAHLHSGSITSIQWTDILKELSEVIGADVFTHFLVNGEGKLELVASGGLPSEFIEKLQCIEPGCFLCGRVFANALPQALEQDTIKNDPDGAELAALGVRCYSAVPLTAEGKCFGTLAFASTQKPRFTGPDQDFFRMTANVVNAARSREHVDELRNQETDRFKNAAEVAKLVVWEADPATADFTNVHGYYEELLGYSKEQWLEPGFWVAHIHPDDMERAVSFCQKSTARQESHRFEYRMKRADGTIIWIDDAVNVIVEDGETVKLQGTLVDITGRKILEQQLIQSQKMEAVGRLAGGISHDFNNLLTVINTSCDLLRLQPSIAASDPATAELIAAIQDAGERASRLTDQLLLFSRSSASQPRSVDINAVLRQATELIARLLGEGICVEMDLADDLPPVLIDSTHLEQLVMNLAVNARDAMPGGGTLRFATGAKASGPNQPQNTREVVLIVSDDGMGMTDEVQSQLFDPFFTTKEIGSGTGLGLAVVFGIVSEAGGSIEVKSAVNQGATFKISLPVSDSRLEQDAISRTAEFYGSGQETILLVEDDAPVRRVACETLKLHGYKVLEACDAKDALRLAGEAAQRIDLLVADVIMPDLSGPLLVEELKRFPSCEKMGVVFVSGYPVSEVAKRGVIFKENNFLQKPFAVEGLLAKVRAQIDASKS